MSKLVQAMEGDALVIYGNIGERVGVRLAEVSIPYILKLIEMTIVRVAELVDAAVYCRRISYSAVAPALRVRLPPLAPLTTDRETVSHD